MQLSTGTEVAAGISALSGITVVACSKPLYVFGQKVSFCFSDNAAIAQMSGFLIFLPTILAGLAIAKVSADVVDRTGSLAADYRDQTGWANYCRYCYYSAIRALGR